MWGTCINAAGLYLLEFSTLCSQGFCFNFYVNRKHQLCFVYLRFLLVGLQAMLKNNILYCKKKSGDITVWNQDWTSPVSHFHPAESRFLQFSEGNSVILQNKGIILRVHVSGDDLQTFWKSGLPRIFVLDEHILLIEKIRIHGWFFSTSAAFSGLSSLT